MRILRKLSAICAACMLLTCGTVFSHAAPANAFYSSRQTDYPALSDALQEEIRSGSLTVEAGKINLLADRITALAGETVKYSVYLAENTGISNGGLRLFHDERLNVVLKDNGDPICKKGAAALDMSPSYAYTPELNLIALGWISTETLKEDGCMFTVSIVVPEDAEAGIYPMKLELDAIRDADNLEIPLKNTVLHDGWIRVAEKQTETTTTTQTATVTTTTASAASDTITSTFTSTVTSVSVSDHTAAETTAALTTPAPVTSDYMKGDVNGDRIIAAEDSQLTLTAYAEILASNRNPLSDIQQHAADINNDGKITIEDAQILLQFYAEILVGNEADLDTFVKAFTGGEDLPVNSGEEMFAAYYEIAAKQLGSMTLEEKVSQMFLVTYPDDAAALSQAETDACPCGYVLFAKDFQNHTPESIRRQMEALKSRSKYGLLLGGDEEGGTVVRASMFPAYRTAAFASPQTLFAQGGMQAVLSDAEEKAVFLKNLGLNYNLAPVADITADPKAYIFPRAAATNAETASALTEGVVRIMNQHDMLSTLKHFPGYGCNLDTHTLVSVDTRSLEEFECADLQPFISGIRAGAPMIMVNHNIIACMDDQKPASLSEAVHRYLRENLSYSGLIITDALTMGAVKEYTSDGESAVQAVLCGNDLIATDAYAEQRQEVLNAVRSGRIPESTVDLAAKRVLACKYYYGILSGEAPDQA